MACDILDFRCIFVNELFGSLLLTLIAVAIAYFVIASKSKFGFDTTLFGAVIVLLAAGVGLGNMSPIMAFLTFIVAVLIGTQYVKLLER